MIILVVVIFGLLAFTWLQTRRVERLYPPSGEFIDVGGYRLHCMHVPAPDSADLPAIVFLHGASGNLLDQVTPFRKRLQGRAELLFIDRPGHGWSQRGPADNNYPDGQARAIAELMNRKQISSALVVGHSFGGIIAANMALETPDKVDGLLLLSSASHPWPGGIDWHYRLAANPLFGLVFSWLLVMPAGLLRIDKVVRCVFSPNAYPPHYVRQTAAALVLRPHTFRYNARDVANLYAHVVAVSPGYGQIDKPTVIITGDTDEIVSPDIHSSALAQAIGGAELMRLRGVGHKPDYAATDLCISALDKLVGNPQDLDAMARHLEGQLAGDNEPSNAPAGGKPANTAAGQIPVMPSDPI
ncbi:MAG: alpha/beta hydrolase [Hyphomicrobiales bacterium]|nr:alpha/beta hydrolase [Hyphomicrobiales bacterium]MCP4999567.1 alpha/beta hydrolase [Hyphomicrobiales bacterium]